MAFYTCDIPGEMVLVNQNNHFYWGKLPLIYLVIIVKMLLSYYFSHFVVTNPEGKMLNERSFQFQFSSLESNIYIYIHIYIYIQRREDVLKKEFYPLTLSLMITLCKINFVKQGQVGHKNFNSTT